MATNVTFFNGLMKKKERRKLNKTLFKLKKVWNIGMPLKVKRQDRDYLVNVMQ